MRLAAAGARRAQPGLGCYLRRWRQDLAPAALARAEHCAARRSLGFLASDTPDA